MNVICVNRTPYGDTVFHSRWVYGARETSDGYMVQGDDRKEYLFKPQQFTECFRLQGERTHF